MGTQVQLFVTCLVDAFYPEVGEATVDLLERAGCAVEFPFDQTCCGQPAFNGGFRDEARAMAIHTVDVLDATDGPIVVPSGSCGQMMSHHIPDLLAGTPHHAAALRVAARVRELTAFLVDDLGFTAAPGAGAAVTYHPSCHGLRGLGLETQPTALIDAAPGVARMPLPDAAQCCGFGGLFSVELPEVSAAMLDEKLEAIESTGADYVVGTDVGCLMHIGGGLRRRGAATRTCHVAELLAGRLP
jgi:L-lactate dehydrogenase complex protein LldE